MCADTFVSALFICRRTSERQDRASERQGRVGQQAGQAKAGQQAGPQGRRKSVRRRYSTIAKEALINEEIRAKEMRVVSAEGEQLGIMSREDALAMAEEKNLDLVCIAPKAEPPVCKILDYGKFKYDQQKKEKEAKKRQHVTQVKEIRLSTFIEDHDIMVKAKTGAKFLKEGNKLKVSLRFRGRERDYVSRGQEVMEKFAEAVAEVGDVEKKPKFEGRSLTMVLTPKGDKK